jgi:hypothetical protein
VPLDNGYLSNYKLFVSSKANYNSKKNYNLCFEGFCTSSAFAPLFNIASSNSHFLPKIQTCLSVFCHNPSLAKVRAKSEAQDSHFMLPRMCEGMNPHTPKWICILGIGVPMDSQILEGDCRGQNLLDWKVFYIIEKLLEFRCLKWALHDPFGHLKHKLWPKEGLGVKLPIWLSTIKIQ